MKVFKRHGNVRGALHHLQYSCPLIFSKLTQGTLDGWYKKALADPAFRLSPAQCTSQALRRGGAVNFLTSSQLATLMAALRESVSSGVRCGSVLLVNRAIALFREQKWTPLLHPRVGRKYHINGCVGRITLCARYINLLCMKPPDGGRPLTMRAPSQAKYHLPDDHAEQFQELLLRCAWRVHENSIPPDCVIAGDETSALLFAMGNGKGRCEQGAKDNARVGADEKRAITVMISVSAGGEMLCLQFIWQGQTVACTPWKHIKDDPALSKHLHSFSKSHWSTPVTIYELVEKVYAPYLVKKNLANGRDKHAVCLLIWDVYYAHRDEGMRSQMRMNFGWISVDFILARGTSKYQPGDQPEINNTFKQTSKQEGDVWLAEKLTGLSAEHKGQIPGKAVLKLLQKSTIGPALPGFAQKGFDAVTKPKIISAWKKTGLDRMFEPEVQLEAVKRHSEGRLFTVSNGHSELHGKPDAYDEPEETILAEQASSEVKQALISTIFLRMNELLGRPPSIDISAALGISGAAAVGAGAASSTVLATSAGAAFLAADASAVVGSQPPTTEGADGSSEINSMMQTDGDSSGDSAVGDAMDIDMLAAPMSSDPSVASSSPSGAAATSPADVVLDEQGDDANGDDDDGIDDDEDDDDSMVVWTVGSPKIPVSEASKLFKEKWHLTVARASPNGHCGFESFALQPAKPSRNTTSMSVLVHNLRMAVASIIETKRNSEYIYIPTLITYLQHDDVEGLGHDELADMVLERAKAHRKLCCSVHVSEDTGLWMNHLDIKCLATFQKRTVFLVDYTTGAANIFKPLPAQDDRACCNQTLANVQLDTSSEAHATQVLLLYGHSHFDAMLFAKSS